MTPESHLEQRPASDSASRGTPADAISIDLGWAPGNHDRTAIALRAGNRIDVRRVSGGDDALVESVAAFAAAGALVVLDVPLGGLGALSKARPRRLLDDRLQRIGIPLLPSVKAGTRGPEVQRLLLQRRPDLVVEESYPYAVLRVLHALALQGVPFDFERAVDVDLAAVWWRWPPRYKRARKLTDRAAAMKSVADLLARVPPFTDVVTAPEGRTGSGMAQLADEYDALLGLVAAVAKRDGSAWSWAARCEDACILSIADGSVRRRFDAHP